MILNLSWKNIWRSKRRSFVVIGAIILGVWALIFIIAFYNGFTDAFVRNAVYHEYSHVQIHHPEYLKDQELKYQLRDIQSLESQLSVIPSLAAYSDRIKVNAMIGAPKTSTGVLVYGIHPDKEEATTELQSQLVEGTYFEKVNRNPILISVDLAEKLDVKVRSKVVLTFQDVNNNITAAAFRVEGIFDSKSYSINNGVVYVRQEDVGNLAGIDQPHEIGILLTSATSIDSVTSLLASQSIDSVRSYKAVAPIFNLMEESTDMTLRMLTVIIMLALLFGIVNTMLMAVLERTREIGMLRSIGMHKSKVFTMILLETLLMGMLAGPTGLLLGYLTVDWLGTRGMDMSMYAEALEEYGAEAIFYPSAEPASYISLMIVVLITAFLGAIYPAIKAVNLNPLEAIRKL